MNQNITVIARVRAKPGKEKELREALLALVEPTRAEASCGNYDLHESIERPGLFFFHENWSSKDGLAQHFETPHIKNTLAKTEALLAEPFEIHALSMISQPEVSRK